MVTSMYFALSVHHSMWPSIVYSESATFRLLAMRMTSHLSGLNFIYQSSHCCRLSRSSWSALASAEKFIHLYRRQSSAKRHALDLTQDGRSLIYTRNSSGPRTVPWGTPYITGAAEDVYHLGQLVGFYHQRSSLPIPKCCHGHHNDGV